MGKRILIIDDENHIRQVMRLTLEAAGYEAGEAADGPKGLEAFGDGSRWDAVLLDQKMPGMDGLETLRHIKERNAGARVIMVTAFASIELAVDAMKLGASDFVRKPMTPEILRNAVTAALTRSGAAAGPQPGPVAEPISGRSRPLVTVVTLNGFRFWPATEAEGKTTASNERLFFVRHPEGPVERVQVEITPQAVGFVERATRRSFPIAGDFWTAQAEHALGAFLWDEGRIPPHGRISITVLDQAAMELAARWEGQD
jgi:DNA-binding response OmpR family regulator